MIPVLAALAAWEAGWWCKRVVDRRDVHARALARSRATGKPLLVVGAPDGGATSSPGGDIVLDIQPSRAPVAIQADIERRIPLPDDSVVVFVCYVLEYVHDIERAWGELQRVSGGDLYVIRVQPWTLTGVYYPGTRRFVEKRYERMR